MGSEMCIRDSPPIAPATDTELAAWLATTHGSLTTAPAPAASDDFAESYLAHRAAEQERGPETHLTTSSPWGPSTDSSPDLW